MNTADNRNQNKETGTEPSAAEDLDPDFTSD